MRRVNVRDKNDFSILFISVQFQASCLLSEVIFLNALYVFEYSRRKYSTYTIAGYY